MNKKTHLKQSTLSLLSSSIFLLLFSFTGKSNIVTAIAPVIVAAGITAASQGAQAFAQGKMNKKTREWNEKMYATQRADALADWNMQNAYNSPEQQMQRLKDAGLNPNLVYGDGNAGATSNSQVRQSDTGNWNPSTPDYGSIATAGIQGMMSYVDMKAKSAQTDNIKVQTQQVEEQIRSQQMDNIAKKITYLSQAGADKAIADATAANAKAKAAQELYNLRATGDVLDGQAGDVSNSSMLKASQVYSEQVRRKNMVDENDRAWIMNAQNVRESMSRITAMAAANAKSDAERKNIIERTNGEKFQNEVKRMEAAMAKEGIKAGDPAYIRKLSQLWNQWFPESSFGDSSYKNRNKY